MSDPHPVETEEVKRASAAILKALEDCGALENPIVSLAALGCIAGCAVAATNDPEAALASVVKAIRGIMDGSLLD